MNIKLLLEQRVKEAVEAVYVNTFEVPKVRVETPSNESFGDYSTNVAMELAKPVKQTPMEAAKKLHYELVDLPITFEVDGQIYDIFEKIEIASPGFINFKLSSNWLKNVLLSKLPIVADYRVGQSRRILIEFSQPNPNKPMHIGHSRNNFLGSSLANLCSFLGYKVVRANYMNDWGTHICKSMLMYEKYGDNKKPDKKSDHFVGDYYVMYERESAAKPELELELAEMFKKLESGDAKTTTLWKKITTWAYEGWQETYKNENVAFDVWQYQSKYKDSGKEIVDIAVKKGIAEKDAEGAVIARLEEKYGIPDKVLLRSDGTSVYSTQDLQLAKDSFEQFGLDKRLYVVDYRQADYFKQIFKILEILGFEWADKLYHVSYGTVELPEGKMSSRKGLVVNSDEVFSNLVELETKEIEKSVKHIENKEDTARKLALAAFRYAMLRVDPRQNIVFNYDDVKSFDGNTGPYLVYTYARARSILSKAGVGDGSSFGSSFGSAVQFIQNNYQLDSKEEAVLRHLSRFGEVVIDACERMLPNVVANYVYELCQRFNSFYASVPVVNAENDDARQTRLGLVSVSSAVLKTGLNLLGIEVVERM